ASSTTVSSSGWPNGPVPSPRPLNALAFAVHGAAIIPVPDLAVASSHPGAFTQGQAGAVYILTASNIGTAPTVGTITVADALPPGLTATAMSGPGWTCIVAAVSCTRNDTLAGGASYPSIMLVTTVGSGAAGIVTNVVTVNGNEVNTANDTFTDTTLILVPGIAATPAFVQQNSKTPASQSIVSVKYTAAQTVGNLNVVAVGWTDTTRQIQAITDTKGNTYVLAGPPTVRPGFGV